MARPRKPTKLKILHGDFEKDPQRRIEGEPQTESGCPDRPPQLTGIARKEWERITHHLDVTGVLTVDMGAAIEQYCRIYQRWRECMDHIKKHGEVIGGKRTAQSRMATELSDRIMKCLIEFGMTPASKTRVQIQRAMDNRNEQAKKFLA